MMQQRNPAQKWFLLVTLLVTCALWAPAAAAQSGSSGVTMTAQAGFDNLYKNAYWAPVQINVANSGPSIEGTLRVIVGSGGFGERIVYQSPIDLPTQSNKRINLSISLPRPSTPTVQLVDGNGRLIQELALNNLRSLTLNSLLYGVVSPNAGDFNFLERVTGSAGSASVAFLTLADLPETAPAWQALDVLILNDVDTAQLTTNQRAALIAWVNTGGQLVVTGGPGWQSTTSAVADLLPVTISGDESVADLPQLSQDAGEPFRDPGPYIVTTSSLRRGELLYRQDSLPLLAYQKTGRGGVFFLALDPKLAPLRGWNGSQTLWRAVAERVSTTPAWGQSIQNGYAASTAVSSLPSLSLPSVWQLILFLLVYIVLIGPINYLVLKKRRQLERAWLTIPLIIIIFSGVAYVTGFQLRGNDVLINQISVAYSEAGSDQARVQSLLGLYSPRRASYDLVLPADTLARPFEQNFGGVEGSGNLEAIAFGNELTLQNIRVDISQVSTFVAQAVRPAIAVDGQAALENDGSDLKLTVTVQNNSDRRLQDVAALLGNTAVSLGDLPPGESRTVSSTIGTVTSSSSFGPRPSPFGVSGGSTLSRHADTILGSSNYFNDEILYPRWQLLMALENNSGPGSAAAVTTNIVTITAWTDDEQIETRLANEPSESLSTTLHLVELPLQQTFGDGGGQVTLPLTLLNTTVLSQDNVFASSVQDLPLNGGIIAFEYTPWPEFRQMTVTGLAIALERTAVTSDPPPQVELWDWQEAAWTPIPDADWGETAVADFTPYIGLNNAIRLRLSDRSQFGVFISAVYPLITGDLP